MIDEQYQLHVGLIGVGNMGRNHLRVLSSLHGIGRIGVLDVSDALNVMEDKCWRACDVANLVDSGIDYCVVATPTSTHLDIGLELAAAGIPTLFEKPLAGDSVSAQTLVRAFSDQGLVAGVGHIERFNPALRLAREKIRQGLLGNLYDIATRRRSPFPGRIDDVGVVMDLATHDIDLTAWLGETTYRDVSARVAHRAGRSHEDLISAVGRLNGGIVASHLVDWLSPYKERSIVITGENGALVIDTLTSDLTFHANGMLVVQREDLARFRGVTEGDVTRFAMLKPEPLRIEHEQFRDAVMGFKSDTVSLVEGMETVRVCQGLLESARSGATYTFR